MILIKNRQPLLLSLFLLLPAATQCMKKKLPEAYPCCLIDIDKLNQLIKNHKPTINEIESNRDQLDTRIMKEYVSISSWAVHSFFQGRHADIIDLCIDNEILEKYKNDRMYAYSLLGPATMAIKHLHNSEKISYPEKKWFIQKLLVLGFAPTPGDRELALVEKWNRCKSIRKNIYLFNCIVNCATQDDIHSLSQIPQDLIKYISLLMFDTEESLF